MAKTFLAQRTNSLLREKKLTGVSNYNEWLIYVFYKNPKDRNQRYDLRKACVCPWKQIYIYQWTSLRWAATKTHVNLQAEPWFHWPRPIPYALQSKVKTELERLESEGVCGASAVFWLGCPDCPSREEFVEFSCLVCSDLIASTNADGLILYPLPQWEIVHIPVRRSTADIEHTKNHQCFAGCAAGRELFRMKKSVIDRMNIQQPPSEFLHVTVIIYYTTEQNANTCKTKTSAELILQFDTTTVQLQAFGITLTWTAKPYIQEVLSYQHYHLQQSSTQENTWQLTHSITSRRWLWCRCPTWIWSHTYNPDHCWSDCSSSTPNLYELRRQCDTYSSTYDTRQLQTRWPDTETWLLSSRHSRKSHDCFRTDHCHSGRRRHCPKRHLPPKHSLSNLTPIAQNIYTLKDTRQLHHRDHWTIAATKDRDFHHHLCHTHTLLLVELRQAFISSYPYPDCYIR